MRGFLLGLVLVASASVAVSATAQAACGARPVPRVEVSTAFEPARDDFSRTIRDLERIGAESAYVDPNGGGGRLLGLTTTRAEIGYKYRLSADRAPGGGFCVSLLDVEIEFALRDNMVRVAREIPRGGCLFREVLLHERKHEAANRKLLAEYGRTLAAGARASIRGLGSVMVADMEAAKPYFEGKLKESLAAQHRAFERESRFRHSAIDSKAEYERISNSCDGELRGVLDVAGG